MSDSEKLSKSEFELIYGLRRNPKLFEAIQRIVSAHGIEPQVKSEEQ